MYRRKKRKPLRIMETDRSLLVKSRTGFLSHRDCMEEEYANELVKQGVKNPRNIPKLTSVIEMKALKCKPSANCACAIPLKLMG